MKACSVVQSNQSTILILQSIYLIFGIYIFQVIDNLFIKILN